MSKFTLSLMVGFAMFCTGCCLRLGENTRVGVNCCGQKDTENFVVDGEETDAAATAVAKPTGGDKKGGSEVIVGLVLAAGLLGYVAWKVIGGMKAKPVMLKPPAVLVEQPKQESDAAQK